MHSGGTIVSLWRSTGGAEEDAESSFGGFEGRKRVERVAEG